MKQSLRKKLWVILCSSVYFMVHMAMFRGAFGVNSSSIYHQFFFSMTDLYAIITSKRFVLIIFLIVVKYKDH